MSTGFLVSSRSIIKTKSKYKSDATAASCQIFVWLVVSTIFLSSLCFPQLTSIVHADINSFFTGRTAKSQYYFLTLLGSYPKKLYSIE